MSPSTAGTAEVCPGRNVPSCSVIAAIRRWSPEEIRDMGGHIPHRNRAYQEKLETPLSRDRQEHQSAISITFGRVFPPIAGDVVDADALADHPGQAHGDRMAWRPGWRRPLHRRNSRAHHELLAEAEGFEPSVGLPLQRLSKPPP